jgi:L,D-transpeptidase catalytic domain
MPNKTFMKIARKTIVLTAGLFLTASAFGYFFWYKPKFSKLSKNNAFAFTPKETADKKEALLRLNKKAIQAKDYITEHGFDDKHCFLLDMRIPSGKSRFFVYNLDKDSVELAGLVTHGSGIANSDTPVFSNTPNSYCTSLGKYKIGKSYNGKFGLAYKLYGLDKTNSRAFDRFVVLHSHECVPDDEVAPLPICESWGCPTVSPAFLIQLKSYLEEATKPVMLWIYY